MKTVPIKDERKPPIVTQEDVARALGISQATVSLALSDNPRISNQLKEKIRHAVQSMNYSPDPHLTALARYRNKLSAPLHRGTIAWVTNYASEHGWKEIPLFDQFYEGASDSLARNGYKLEVYWMADPKLDLQRFRRMLINRGIKGILFAPQQCPNTNIELPMDGFAAVTFGFSLAYPKLHVVHGELFAAVRTLYRELRNRRHRKIGLLLTRQVDERTSNHILGAFLAESYLENLLCGNRIMRIDEYHSERTQIVDWIKVEKLDAVLTTGVNEVDFLRDCGFRIPDDFSVAVHLLTQKGETGGMLLNALRIGEIAAQRLLSMLHNWETGSPDTAEHIAVEQSFYPGRTIRNRSR